MPLRNSEGQWLWIRMIPEFQRGTEAQRGLMTCHDSWAGLGRELRPLPPSPALPSVHLEDFAEHLRN